MNLRHALFTLVLLSACSSDDDATTPAPCAPGGRWTLTETSGPTGSCDEPGAVETTALVLILEGDDFVAQVPLPDGSSADCTGSLSASCRADFTCDAPITESDDEGNELTFVVTGHYDIDFATSPVTGSLDKTIEGEGFSCSGEASVRASR